MAEPQPAPPRAYAVARDIALAHGWEVKELRTHGVGTHPTRGYGRVWFADLLGVRGDVRVIARWVAGKPQDWTAQPRIEGRWAQAIRPLAQLRGDIDPAGFRRLALPKGADPFTLELASMPVLHELLSAADPRAWVTGRAPEPRCAVCRAVCHWSSDAWVCTRTSCGSEWDASHGGEYAALEVRDA